MSSLLELAEPPSSAEKAMWFELIALSTNHSKKEMDLARKGSTQLNANFSGRTCTLASTSVESLGNSLAASDVIHLSAESVMEIENSTREHHVDL